MLCGLAVHSKNRNVVTKSMLSQLNVKHKDATVSLISSPPGSFTVL